MNMELLFLPLVILLAVWTYVGFRKQKKMLAQAQELQDSLKPGTQVITTSGLYGTVVELDEDTVDLEIAEDVITTWMRQAIREVVKSEPGESVAADDEQPAATAQTTADSSEAPAKTAPVEH